MNCPFHVLIFKSRQRSYRELPLRLFEFGTVYRYEKSGRGPRPDPGPGHDPGRRPHLLYPRADGRRAAHHAVLRAVAAPRLRPQRVLPRAVDPSRGQGRGHRGGVGGGHRGLAPTALAMDLELVLDEGGGAFYGPKISVQARDAIGRTHQMSTIQLDFQTPQRFEAEYIGADNARHRPIMIHRALFGSVERFFAILLEHYAGALPTWLSPEQVRVLAVRDDHEEYADKVAERLARHRGAGVGGSGRRAARRPYPPGQGAEDPLRPGGGRRRCPAGTVGVNRRGSKQPERGVELTAFTEALERGDRRTSVPEDPVSLEHLWAGWRSQYVTSAGRRRTHRGPGTAAAETAGDPATTPPTACSVASPPADPRPPTTASCGRASCTFAVLNAYPYASGHLMVMPIRHVRTLADLSDAESTELWSALRHAVAGPRDGLRARGDQPGGQPGPGGRSRHPPPPPPPRRTPVGGRHQLHDHRGRRPGPARGADRHLGAPDAPGPTESRARRSTGNRTAVGGVVG